MKTRLLIAPGIVCCGGAFCLGMFMDRRSATGSENGEQGELSQVNFYFGFQQEKVTVKMEDDVIFDGILSSGDHTMTPSIVRGFCGRGEEIVVSLEEHNIEKRAGPGKWVAVLVSASAPGLPALGLVPQDDYMKMFNLGPYAK